MNKPYSLAAAAFILRDIGECSCAECVMFYLLEYKQSAPGNSHRGLRLLARENAMSGAINFNLEMRDAAEGLS